MRRCTHEVQEGQVLPRPSVDEDPGRQLLPVLLHQALHHQRVPAERRGVERSAQGGGHAEAASLELLHHSEAPLRITAPQNQIRDAAAGQEAHCSSQESQPAPEPTRGACDFNSQGEVVPRSVSRSVPVM